MEGIENIHKRNYNIYLLKNGNFHSLKNRNIEKGCMFHWVVFIFFEHLFSINEYKKLEKSLL